MGGRLHSRACPLRKPRKALAAELAARLIPSRLDCSAVRRLEVLATPLAEIAHGDGQATLGNRARSSSDATVIGTGTRRASLESDTRRGHRSQGLTYGRRSETVVRAHGWGPH
jgi:hypothetical protein